jgi:outer membrane protein OmpA-like peptidoglycan-associated protein
MASALLLLALAESASAQDIAGAKDHPVLSRVAGSRITEYHVDPDGQCLVPLGPAQGRTFTESQKAQGKITRITYAQRPGLSVGDVYRDFSKSFASSGIRTLFTCNDESCGTGQGSVISCTGPWNGANGQRQFTGASEGPNGAAIVSLHVQAPFNRQMAVAVLTVIEVGNGSGGTPQGVGAGMSPESIQQFKGRGFVELDEPLFQQGSSQFTTQASDILQGVATYLKNNPSLHVFVVNHTDNESSWQEALNLSRSRAQAIVHALVTRYGIQANRLVAQGVGPLAPVADVRTDAGQEKNTRTVLVEIQ